MVAEIEGHVRGFVLGRESQVGRSAKKEGEILMLGVHPDYWRNHVATRLINALCDKYRSSGLRTVHIEIDPYDKQLLYFFEKIGFGTRQRVNYTKYL